MSHLIYSVGDERGDHIWTRLVSLMRRRRLNTPSFRRSRFKSLEQRTSSRPTLCQRFFFVEMTTIGPLITFKVKAEHYKHFIFIRTAAVAVGPQTELEDACACCYPNREPALTLLSRLLRTQASNLPSPSFLLLPLIFSLSPHITLATTIIAFVSSSITPTPLPTFLALASSAVVVSSSKPHREMDKD